jgi:hypothetical protein
MLIWNALSSVRSYGHNLQGYLSFWNDNISYALRGCILIELALRRRIALVKDPIRKRSPLPERLVEVIDDRQTGETILDEALKMMKAQEPERMAINSWVDLLSGESSLMRFTPISGYGNACLCASSQGKRGMS